MTTPPPPFDDEQYRLDECVLEPIRTPGTIQPHGVLLGIDPGTSVVLHVSDNCGALLGIDAESVLGFPIDTITGSEWAGEHRTDLADGSSASNPLSLAVGGQRFDVIVHHSGSVTILELEPVLVGAGYESAPAVYSAINRLAKAKTNTELWRAAARELRAMTQFDRVMIYHFHPDGHGEVVAEEAAEGMEPFLGLHYPASDIPAQARDLYLTKLSRLIVNSSGETASLLSVAGQSDDEEPSPLDLSGAELRSVSPHHLQFMRNMGQASTLSLSLIKDNELIGMITMAHRTPHRVPYILREGLVVLASQVALQLGAMVEIQRLTQQMQMRSIRARLVDQLLVPLSPEQSDVARAPLGGDITMLDLIAAQGAMLSVGGTTTSTGTVPSSVDVQAAASWARSHRPGITVVSEALAEDFPVLSGLLPTVTGLIIVPLSAPGDFLAWFRPELIADVHWLGDQTAANRLTPLSPRTSFSSWTESVSGRSAPWDGLESEGEELARDLAGAMLRRSEAKLAALAFHDALTGLPNRRLLMDRIDHALAGYDRGVQVAVLFVDLDSFKSINDTLGHDIGDALLIHTAKQISGAVRTHDTVARLGGDEFVVLCENASEAAARQVADRIVDAIRQPGFINDTVLTATASVGIATATPSVTGVDLLRKADEAMYRAKALGRDRTSH